MSNEEAARRIQGGEQSAIPLLWEGVKKFIRLWAYKYHVQYESLCKRAGVEKDDLYQCGYFAMLNAVRAYDATTGYRFITYMAYHLQNEFNAAVGVRTVKGRNNARIRLISIEAEKEGADGLINSDSIPDEAAREDFDNAIDNLYSEEARRNLAPALERLSADEYEVTRRYFYQGQKLSEIARDMGAEYHKVQRLYGSALRRLRHAKEVQEYKEEYMSLWAYRGTGFASFRDRQESSVERATAYLEELREKLKVWGYE